MKSKHWSKEDISSFCLEMSLLLKAGMPLDICFSILEEEAEEQDQKALFHELHEETRSGISVYESMGKKEVFPSYMLQMILLGEETGYLENVFHSLSVYYEERRRIERMLKETVIFPIALLCMMIIVILVLMIEVLPVFQSVFVQLGGTLPPLAIFFLNIGLKIQEKKTLLFILFALVLIGILFIAFHGKTNERWKQFLKRKFFRMEAGRLFEAAHFASALHMGISGGLGTDKALEMAGAFCEENIQEKVRICRECTMIGESLAHAVSEQGLLKPAYCGMISVGTKTGTLDAALAEISRRSEEEAEEALRKMAAKVEPTVVVILCVVVGILLLSVMFPLIGIMNSL